jgi:hypothetical protein
MIKPVGKKLWHLTAVYGLFIVLFVTSRYASGSTFNGETRISQLAYLGSLIAFFVIMIWMYVRTYYKDKDVFKRVKELDSVYFFVFIWFLFMVIAARSAVRLLFVFSPVTAVLMGYLSVRLAERGLKLKEKIYKVAAIAVIILLFGTIFMGFSKTVLAQGKYTGPSYNQQWQTAMKWVRENTPEDAIFAHWWDYGYWVQTGGERTTLSDGGNALGAVNHFMGRHVLTAQSETEALEFLKARNATNLLMIVDEVGKYPAFSSIGADANYDRYSWIPTFTLDMNRVQEKRNQTVYLYAGGTPLDDDFVYNNRLFPANSAAIGGFFIPMQETKVLEGNETKTAMNIFQPDAVLFHNGQQVKVPLECVYYNGKKINFQKKGLPGCLRIIPTIESNGQANPLGAALYLSRDVKDSLFARLFLMNEQTKYFKIAYSDESGMPLAIYRGRLIGPLKIWDITYPENLTIPPEYYGTTLPDPKVDSVRR